MQSLEQLAATWQRGAVVLLKAGDGPINIRPAAFVFETPTGLAWVEPSYSDPMASPAPALHYRDGEAQILPGLVVLQAGDERVEVRAYEDDDAADVGDALEWFAGDLAARGESWQDEREFVRALIDQRPSA